MHILRKRARARNRARPPFSFIPVLLSPLTVPTSSTPRLTCRSGETVPTGSTRGTESAPRRADSWRRLGTNPSVTIGEHCKGG